MLNVGVIVIISCILTAITMVVFSGFLFVLVQSGGKGVQAIFNRFFGGGDDRDAEKQPSQETAGRARPQISSGEALRQRAQSLEFAPQAAAAAQGFSAQQARDPLAAPPQAGSNFNAQAQDPLAPPQQASFSARETLGQPQQNQYGQSQTQPPFAQSSPSMPTLSSARPFDAGQQVQYQAPQQPLSGNQYGQASQGRQQNQTNQNPPLPPIGGQSYQAPQQPLSGNQYGQQQAQGGQQQQPPQQGLGDYRPPLSGVNADQSTSSPSRLKRNRDGRRGDDHDRVYDDGDGGIGDYIGDLGDFLG